MKEGSKYYPLYAHLKQNQTKSLTLTLPKIEQILGITLPQSAHVQRGWWSNRSKGALQARAWMQAGYHVTKIDLGNSQISFSKPKLTYEARQLGDTVQWTGELINGLRQHMGLKQGEMADELGVRQQTISEWERGSYLPSRATSKYLSLVAERAGFSYQVQKEDKPEDDLETNRY